MAWTFALMRAMVHFTKPFGNDCAHFFDRNKKASLLSVPRGALRMTYGIGIDPPIPPGEPPLPGPPGIGAHWFPLTIS